MAPDPVGGAVCAAGAATCLHVAHHQRLLTFASLPCPCPQLIILVVSWLIACTSTAIAVAIQRVDGTAVDTTPMYRRLEVPFSRLTAEIVAGSHSILRMLLVFWFSAAYVSSR